MNKLKFILLAAFFVCTGAVADNCAAIPDCPRVFWSSQYNGTFVLENDGFFSHINTSKFEEYRMDSEVTTKHVGTWSCSDAGIRLAFDGQEVTAPLTTLGEISHNDQVHRHRDLDQTISVIDFTHLDKIYRKQRENAGQARNLVPEPVFSSYFLMQSGTDGTGEKSCAGISTAEAGASQKSDTQPAVDQPPADVAVADGSKLRDHDKAEAEAENKNRQTNKDSNTLDADLQAIYSSHAGIFDHFGYTVSLSADGDTLAVGAPLESGHSRAGHRNKGRGFEATGAVTVYVRKAERWIEQAWLKPAGADPGDRFGYSVSLSDDGDTLAVGAPQADMAIVHSDGQSGERGNAVQDAGAVYVFVRSTKGLWTQKAHLTADVAYNFGDSVFLSGDAQVLVATASRWHDEVPVHIFARTRDSWMQKSVLATPANDLSIANSNPNFAWAVAVNKNGSVLAVSAPGWNTIFVYTRDSTGWQLSESLAAPVSKAGSLKQMGMSVSLNSAGDLLTATALQYISLYRKAERGSRDCPVDCLEQDTSQYLPFYTAVVIYELVEDGWIAQDPIWLPPIISRTTFPDLKHSVISMSQNGGAVVVGGYSSVDSAEVATVSSAGSIPVISENGRSAEVPTVSSDDGIPFISENDRRRIEENKHSTYPSGHFGTTWFVARKDGVWQKPERFRLPGTADAGRFGHSVAIDATGQTFVVGAPRRGAPVQKQLRPLKVDDNITQAGAVFTHSRPGDDD